MALTLAPPTLPPPLPPTSPPFNAPPLPIRPLLVYYGDANKHMNANAPDGIDPTTAVVGGFAALIGLLLFGLFLNRQYRAEFVRDQFPDEVHGLDIEMDHAQRTHGI